MDDDAVEYERKLTQRFQDKSKKRKSACGVTVVTADSCVRHGRHRLRFAVHRRCCPLDCGCAGLSNATKANLAASKKQRRRYTRRSSKRGNVIRVLAAMSQLHKDAADRAAAESPDGEVPDELQTIFQNPFKVCPTGFANCISWTSGTAPVLGCVVAVGVRNPVLVFAGAVASGLGHDGHGDEDSPTDR